jgi:hypothetical protein
MIPPHLTSPHFTSLHFTSPHSTALLLLTRSLHTHCVLLNFTHSLTHSLNFIQTNTHKHTCTHTHTHTCTTTIVVYTSTLLLLCYGYRYCLLLRLFACLFVCFIHSFIHSFIIPYNTYLYLPPLSDAGFFASYHSLHIYSLMFVTICCCNQSITT